MSAYIESIFNGTNEIAARKLMDASVVEQRAISSNIANVDVKGYHKVGVSATFEAQLQALVEAGDTAGIEALQPTIETAQESGGISIEDQLMKGAKNTLNYQVLAMLYGTNMEQVKAVVTE